MFNSLLTREEAALVLVDVQERLLPAIANKDTLLPNVMRLIRFAQILKLPIIASEQIKIGPLVPEILSMTPGLRIVVKSEFDALKNQDFAATLAALNRKVLILVGLETHICVSQTVIHALPDYRVHVIADAVGSRATANWVVGLDRMRQAGAVISSTEMVMYELLERAGTDEFKAVLELVKSAPK